MSTKMQSLLFHNLETPSMQWEALYYIVRHANQSLWCLNIWILLLLWYLNYILIDLIGMHYCIWTINSTINIQYMPPSFKWISKVLTLSSSELHIVCFSSRTSRGPCFVRVKSWPRRKNAFRFIHGGMERWNIRF